MYSRECPYCKKEIVYLYKSTYKNSIKKNSLCGNCSSENRQKFNSEITDFKRECPGCNEDIFYKSAKTMKEANDKNRCCSQKCEQKRNIEIKRYIRNCPICKKEIIYPNKGQFNRANKNNSTCCRKCKIEKDGKEYIRICPCCEKEIKYRGLKEPKKAIKNNTLCRSCSSKKQMNRQLEQGKFFSTNNRKNVYSGKYKNINFRSRLELSYLYHLLNNDIKFVNGEKRIYSVLYVNDKGEEKLYLPDFYLIDDDLIIEIKYTKDLNLPENILKFEAAKNIYFDKFKVLTEKDISLLSHVLMYELFLKGDLNFDREDQLEMLKLKYREHFGDSYE